MCGIFGYVGPRATKTLLLEGLKRLEYRGYDSWGIGLGTGTAETIHIVKESGRIAAGTTGGTAVATAAGANGTQSSGNQSYWGGIAHTRWATHGAPTKANAHPHAAAGGRIAIVHNGIVENHLSLKISLEAKGCIFTSETDSEVIGHLIADLMKEGIDFEDAFLGTLRLLEGTYGIAAIHAGHPGLVLAGRKGSPMVLGIGDGEVMIASDPSALVAHTRNVVYLEDGEVAVLRPEGLETKDLDAVPITKQIEKVAFDLPSIEKGGYAHFMLKEIFETREPLSSEVSTRVSSERHGAVTSLPAAPHGMPG